MGTDQKRAILAVVLSGLILFGWQYFFAPKSVPTTVVKTEVVNREASPISNTSSNEKDEIKSGETSPKAVETITLISNEASFTLDNFLAIKDARFNNADSGLKEIFPSKDLYSIQFLVGDVFKNTYFSFSNLNENSVSVENQELGISGKIILDDKGKLNYNLTSTKNFNYRFVYKAEPKQKSAHNLKQFVFLNDDFNTVEVGDDDKGDSRLKWFGLDFDYHIFTNVLPERTSFIFNISEAGVFTLNAPQAVNTLSFYQVFAKKEYDLLVDYGDNLKLSVDFGIMSIIAVPILRGLQFFYTLLPNYGISIIFLTLLIRMLTFPLQYKSFKSMKKMQIIQPELTKMREKFKKDPQRLQQETMALFKKAGANPLGGCLPLILQMPIFFAFYQVLYSAVELVDAPFILWISDLSEKDPYYVLPILMSVAMFFQQKLTPTAISDPVQKKVMMFMPLIFGLIMKDLPSGLTLYIFVSTLFGMGQQLFVYKRVS